MVSTFDCNKFKRSEDLKPLLCKTQQTNAVLGCPRRSRVALAAQTARRNLYLFSNLSVILMTTAKFLINIR